jgi:hypothetical protein
MSYRRNESYARSYNASRGYYSHESHAYNIPIPAPEVMPEVEIKQKPKAMEEVVVRQKEGISVLTYLLVFMIAACAFATVYYVAAIQGNAREIRQIRAERVEVRRLTLMAASVLKESYNIAEVEEMAPRFGLAMPAPHQEIRIYVTPPVNRGGHNE